MDPDPGGRSSRPEPRDVLQSGSLRPRGGRLDRWLPVILAALVVLAAVAKIEHTGRRTGGRAPVTVTEAGHRLLGVTAGWDMFGFGPDGVVRVQFARGQLTRTTVPGQLSAPLSFVAGPSQVIIRPLDNVPGFLVPDGRPARRLAGAFSRGGTVIPGPGPGLVWFQAGYQVRSLTLDMLGGQAKGPSIPLPSGGPWLVAADGSGYALIIDGVSPGLVYDARPGLLRPVRGTVTATGTGRLMTVQCGNRHCFDVVVDPRTGSRRVLTGRPVALGPVPGAISPDGSTAAIIRSRPAGTATLHLISLQSGADLPVAVPLDPASLDAQSLAWSPDSRWLFVIAAGGKLRAVAARTGQVSGIGITLPPLSQVIIRTAPR